MQYVRGLEQYHNTRRTAITLGKFDGLHLGHEMLVGQVIAHQQQDDVDSVVFAFDMAPLYQRLNKTNTLLVTNAERAAHLDGRVDYLVECPFVDAISHIEAEDFITEVLVAQFHVKYVVVGTDFRFGYQKRGDYRMLQEYAKRYNFSVEVIEKKCYQSREISSTYIKKLLAKGNIRLVNELLGYPYQIEGVVITGQQLGRTIGVPTMNICPQKEKGLPPNGVYACKVQLEEEWYYGVCNIGTKPTVSEEVQVLLETHLFQYQGDAYGKKICVQLWDYERAECRFSSVEALKEQLEKDILYAKKYFDIQE